MHAGQDDGASPAHDHPYPVGEPRTTLQPSDTAAMTRSSRSLPAYPIPDGHQPAKTLAARTPVPYGGLVERRRHYWNGKWGRIARKDILISEDAGRWLIEARDGGAEGRSRWPECTDEDAALIIVRDLMSDEHGWKEIRS